MRLQYCQLLRSTHFTRKLRCAKAQDCFPVLAFDLVRERYVVATTSEATSCARFWRLSTSGNVAYNLLDGMNRLAMASTILSMVLQPFFRFRRARLTRLHFPSTTMGSLDGHKTGNRHVGGEGGFKAFYGYRDLHTSCPFRPKSVKREP